MTDFLEMAQAAVDADHDHLDTNSPWLMAQLARYPTRVHPERTTNLRFLTMSAVAVMLGHARRVSELLTYNNEQVERRRALKRQLDESVQLLHTARRLIRGTNTDEAMIFLANSENFIADELGEKPSYETHPPRKLD